MSDDFYDDTNFRIDRSLGFLVTSIAARLGGWLDERLLPDIGIGVTQWRALAYLHDGHAATAAELCTALRYDSGAMVRMVDKLEANGLLAREPDPNDRRTYRLKLTKKGKATCDRGFELARENLNSALAGLSREQAEELITSLQTVNRTLIDLKK